MTDAERARDEPLCKTLGVPACGARSEYFYGDPQPPKEAGYAEFVEWQEAQFRHRKRKSK